MRRLRLAIVGCGSITQRGILPHLLLERDRIKITALCDTSEVRLGVLIQKFDIPNVETFTSLDELLRTSNAEAVAIATPIPVHYNQALDSLYSGRHVYIQKTMTQTPKEAAELIHIAHSNRLKIAASPGQMLLPAYSRARELILEGLIGTVYMALGVNMGPGHEYEAFRSETGEASPNPTWYYRQGGGPLRDMGVYSLHAICGILGRAKRVVSLATSPVPERYFNNESVQVEINDNVSLTLDLGEERLAIVCTTFSQNPEILRWGHLVISGSEGSVEIRRLRNNSSRYELFLKRGDEVKPRRQTFGTGLSREHDALEEAHVARDLLDFVDAVLDNHTPGASAEDALHVIEIIEAAERASQTNSVVKILTNP